MKNQKLEMKLPTVDDLFTTQEERDYERAEKIEVIPISKIKDFKEHPFKVVDDEKMDKLVESIKENGVLSPAIVRKNEDGTYEMISGHRRKHASIRAGLDTIKCIVKDLTDDEATILMVDSNIQREEILPSEKAFAYKMKLEAIKHQGKNVASTSRPLVEKLVSADVLGEEQDESGRQIHRFIRLTELVPELLDLVDSKKLGFRTAVELSYLSVDNQYVVADLIEQDQVVPSLSQGVRLKKIEKESTLTEEKIEEILSQEKANQKEKVRLNLDEIQGYFPKNVSSKQMVEKIKELLQNYQKQWLTEQRDNFER